MRLFSVIALASFVVSSFASTVADVKADIVKIFTQLTALDDLITAFPSTGGSLTQVFAIHSSTLSSIAILHQVTTDVAAVVPLPISKANARAILTAFETLGLLIELILNGFIIQKPAFDALPIGGITALVKQNLVNLDIGFAPFEDAVFVLMPADFDGEAAAVKRRIGAAFVAANAAYA